MVYLELHSWSFRVTALKRLTLPETIMDLDGMAYLE